MQSSMIQPAADAAGRLHASLIDMLRHLGADQTGEAKTLLAQIHGPLGDLLGRILPVCINEPLRFQVETTQFNHLREIGTDPDDPLVPFTISLMEGIEITCGPWESVSRGDRPIIFIERQTTGRTLCVNSPDNGDPAAVVIFHADGSATGDDVRGKVPEVLYS